MQSLRWPLALAVMALCALLTAPFSAETASASPRRGDTVSSSHTSSAAKGHKARAAKSKKSKAHAQHSKRHKDRTALSRKGSKKTSGRKSRKATAQAERDLWLQRAQESELMTGKASWYGRDAHGGATASGMRYDMYTFTAAHRTLPMGTVVRVTDQQNGRNVMVCVTDRGPYVSGRIIDLSFAAARQLELEKRGVSNVALEVVSDAAGKPLKDNEAFYVRYRAAMGEEKVGPFRGFADAAAMHEALRQAHPEAEVVLVQDR